jgi:hypothetical protein
MDRATMPTPNPRKLHLQQHLETGNGFRFSRKLSCMPVYILAGAAIAQTAKPTRMVHRFSKASEGLQNARSRAKAGRHRCTQKM